MRTEEQKDYNVPYDTQIRSLNYEYLGSNDYPASDTGIVSDLIAPALNFNDSIFSELPSNIINNLRVQPFLVALYDAYQSLKKPSFTYLPIILGECEDDNIILDWVYETVRIALYFMKDKELYSVIKYDKKNESYSQKIEEIRAERYKEIASQLIREIA